MSERVRAFIIEQPILLAPGTTLHAAVAGLDSDLAAALAEGTAHATDGVGRRIDPAVEVAPGAIFRVVRSARRSPRDAATA